MWKIWIIFSVFKFSFSAPVNNKEESAPSTAGGDNPMFRCLLLASHISSCDDLKRYSNHIPRHLQKLYDKVKKPFTGKDDALLDTNTIEAMPTSLFYLIPRIRLQNITGQTAGKILRRTPDDEALTIKLASLMSTDVDRTAFLETLSATPEQEAAILSDGVDWELGRALSIWYNVGADWHHDRFQSAMEAGSPVLAHLPAHFINRLTPKVTEKFLFHIRNWRPDYTNNTQVWENHPTRIKRIWTYTALQKWEQPSKWFPGVARIAGYMLLGATADEMSTIVKYMSQPSLMNYLLEMSFPALQARELFDIAHSSYPEYVDLKFARNLLPNLLPRQIQQYDAAAVDVSSQLTDSDFSSLPTQKQLLEHHVANLVISKKLPSVSPESWKNDISLLGKLIHLLPASSLEGLKNEILSFSTLSSILSDSLSFRQVRYLTNNGNLLNFDHIESIISVKSHLKALPAHSIDRQHNVILPELMQGHLIRHAPVENKALVYTLLEKIHMDLDERSLLIALLANGGHNEILSLLNGRDLITRIPNLKKSLASIIGESDSQRAKIQRLPSNIGRMLLTDFRREIASTEDGWTLDNLILNPVDPLLRTLISNLQCVDIDRLNDVDALAVIGYYVRERRALNLPFPKNMQYCCQKALTRYLKLKSAVRHNEEDSGLLNQLELFEVKAVGGYILSSLPLDNFDSTLLKHHIIREIGTLSLPELLTATPLLNLHILADAFATSAPLSRELNLREMVELGSLVWYLDFAHVRRLNPGQFKLVLEMMEPNAARAPCFTTAERELWREFLIQSVGKPNTWSAGTVALLGDLLFIFDSDDLDMISASARVESADVLANNTAFHHQVEWPGKLKPITYFEACTEALPPVERSAFTSAVHSLIRFYLDSSQMLLDTVIPADTLVSIDSGLNSVDTSTESSTKSPQKLIIKRTADGLEKKKRKNGKGKKRKSTTESSSAEDRKRELLTNGTRALVIVFEQQIDDNNTRLSISESFPRRSISITCDAIRMLGMPASWVVTEDDLKKWTPLQLDDCAELLGSLSLSTAVRKAIWPRLGKWRESQNFLEVGNLVAVIEEDDLLNLNFDLAKPWALETLQVLAEHVVNQEMLPLITNRFILHNTNVTSLRYGAAAALGKLVCTIPKSRQQKLLLGHRVFTQVAPILGASVDDDLCISQLADIAKIAYGPPKEWSADDVTTLGSIMAGLTKTDFSGESSLQAEALSGLTPLAVSHIPPEVFKVLSEDQLSQLSPMSVAAISTAQSSSLSPSQSEVLERVRRQIPDKNLRASRSSATTNFSTMLTTLAAIFAITVRALV